jgi:arylsulfatase A-like enzyme
VVISLDTTRADHLPTYGYARPTAPRINAFAERSIVFTNAFAQETNTNPSHASMFTGLYPHQHGSLDNGFRLVSKHPTLAEHLSDAGLRCGAFVSARTMQGTTGLGRGCRALE